MTTKKTRKKSPSKICVIDNFLPKDTFKKIKDICSSGDLAWYRSDGISNNDSTNAVSYTHLTLPTTPYV